MNLSKSSLVLIALLGLGLLFVAASAVADPGNDDPTEAEDVYDGNTVDSRVQAASTGTADDDWFRIALTEGQYLKLNLLQTSDPANGFAGIRVYGNDTYTIELDHCTRDDRNVQEIDLFVFASGVYYIKVYVFVGDEAQYLMDIHILDPPILKHDTWVNNNARRGLLGSLDSTMHYRIYLEGGSDLAQICEVESNWQGAFDLHLLVEDRKDAQSLGLLNYSWSRDHDGSESCKFGASYTGYYYITVASGTFASEGEAFFNLKANIQETKHRSDGNVVMDDAEHLDIRQTVNGKIDQAFDTREYYKFWLNEDEQFSAKATITDSHLQTYWDYYNLTLYTADGRIITGATNEGTTGAPISICSLFKNRAPYSGIYYLSFSAWYSLSGSGTTDYTQGRQVNTCKFEIDVLIPNRRVWIVEPPDVIEMQEDTFYEMDLSKIFWDPEDDDLFYGTIGGKDNFTVILSQTKATLTLTPHGNWYGEEEITIFAHDGRPDQKNSTIVYIEVISVPDPPFVKAKAPNRLTIYEDEVNTTALDLDDVFGDVDIEDSFLEYTVDQNEKINIEIDPFSGEVTFWGIPNYNGEQRIIFYASDTYNFREDHSITITVEPTNDPPEPMKLKDGSIYKIKQINMEEGKNSFIDVGPHFEDIDLDPLYYVAQWDHQEAISFDNKDSDPLNSWFDIYPEDPNFAGYVQVTFICYDRDPLDPLMEPEEARQSAILYIEEINDPPRIDVYEPDDDKPIEIMELDNQTLLIDSIYDVDSDTFRYKWFVNDYEQTAVSGKQFEFPTDVKNPRAIADRWESAGTYYIRCEVKDHLGELADVTPEWTLDVRNSNRRPIITFVSEDLTTEEGRTIDLKAEAYDQDSGDDLKFEWYQVLDNNVEKRVGVGPTFSTDDLGNPLIPGKYRFKCYVSDFKGGKVESNYIYVEVTAHEFPPTLPGFGALFAALAFIAATGSALYVHRRR